MSIYSYLEKIALIESMPRGQFSDAAIPYKERKKKYKKFINRRAKTKKPSNTEYVPGMAVLGGVVGGLVGAGSGEGAGVLVGGLMGAGIGALGGLASATNEQVAIDNARKVVKGGNYNKALQDEITSYRRHKAEQARQEREWDRIERRIEHQSISNRLDRIENQNSTRNVNVTIRRY